MRNKILLLPAFLFVFLFSNLSAQDTFNKGGFIIGSSVGFSSASSNVEVTLDGVTNTGGDASASQLTLAPKLGYFLADRFVLGLGMEYTFNRVSEPVNIADLSEGTQTDFDSDLLFGPFARYYLPIGEDMAFFGEFTFGFGSSRDRINFQESRQEISTNVFAVGMGPGVTILSNNLIGIEAIVKYNFARSSYDINSDTSSSNTVSWTNQIDLSLGVQFYIGRITVSSTGDGGSVKPKENNTPRRNFF